MANGRIPDSPDFVCPPRGSSSQLKRIQAEILAGRITWRTRPVGERPTLELNEIEVCYFAALIHALRLIDEKAREKGVQVLTVDGDALVHYVRAKGDELVALYLSEQKVAA